MKKLLYTSALVLCLSNTTAANAQSIDYTTMQDMFGEPVTTSATGKPQRASDVPVTMEIITAEEIRRSGAVDIPEVLRQVNGVNVLQGSSQGYDVSIRGYNSGFSQRLLVLVNGRQVYDDIYGYTAWSTIPVQLEEIRQIEVVKGPNTALFGFNAVSGVINIVTYNPLYDDESSAGIRVGTNDYRQAHYVQSLKLNDDLGIRISAGKRESDSFSGDINGITALTERDGSPSILDPEKESINIDGIWQVTDKSQLRAELSGSNTQQGELSVIGTAFDSQYETRSGKLSYEVDSDYGLIKANIYKNFLEWTYNLNSVVSNEVLVAQLEDTFSINPQHTLRFGLEYRDNSMTTNGETAGIPLISNDAEIGYQVYAASAMWNWDINEKISLTNALRYDYLDLERSGPFQTGNPYTNNDYNNADTSELSYNSAVNWELTPNDTIRIGTARGLEVPSVTEYGADARLAPFTIVGDPNLETAVVTNYEVAWDHKINAWDNGLFRSALFHQKTQDIKTVFVQNGLLLESQNVGTSKSYGIELALEGAFNDHFDWELGYTYQNIKDDIRNDANNDGVLEVPKEFEEFNPEHQIKAQLGYKDGPWEADALAYYASSTKQLRGAGITYVPTSVDSYVGLNARVGYTFDNDITVAISGNNLQSANTQTSNMPDVERRVFLSLTKKF